VIEAGCYYAKQFPAEDRGLWRRIVANGGKVANLPEGLVLKRRHGDAVTLQHMLHKGASRARIHHRMATNAYRQGFMPAARKHAWRSWRADRWSPRRFAFAAVVGTAATVRLAGRIGLAPELRQFGPQTRR
jgi:hypothetical protein